MKSKTWKGVLHEILIEVSALTFLLFLFASGIWLLLNTLK